MSIEKTYFNKSRKSLIQQLLFKVALFRFHFDSALKYLGCCYDKYLVKQIASLYLQLPLKPVLFQCVFAIFWNKKSLLILTLFSSEYLDQFLPWKEIKEEFSVRIQTEKLRFCFK